MILELWSHPPGETPRRSFRAYFDHTNRLQAWTWEGQTLDHVARIVILTDREAERQSDPEGT